MAKVMREKILHYLNTGTVQLPTWSLINEGVTSLSTNFNPETEEEAYIADSAKTKTTTGLALETTFDMNRVRGDAANDKIFTLVWGRKVGTDADTELLTVNMSASPVNTDQYPAIKDTVNVIYNSIGDEAIKPLKIGVTLGHQGNPTTGLYDVSGFSFA
jgi:hypothetical protein